MNARKINSIRREPRAADWISGAQVRGLLLLAFAVIAWLGSRNASADSGVVNGAGPGSLHATPAGDPSSVLPR